MLEDQEEAGCWNTGANIFQPQEPAYSSCGSMMERAMLLTEDRNDPGKQPRSNPSSSSSGFLLLPRASDSHFLQVAKDAHVIFRPEKGSPATQISAICAQEVVQADLAAAVASRELARTRAQLAKGQALAAVSSTDQTTSASAGVLTRSPAAKGTVGTLNLFTIGKRTLSSCWK